MIAQLDASYVKTRPYKVWSRVISHLFSRGHFQTGAAKYRFTAEDAGLIQQQTARKLFRFYAGLTCSR